MKPRFQADADLNHVILLAVIRREPMVAFQSAVDGGLAGLTDPEVLAHAAAHDRVLVTHDRTTMPEHFARFIESHPSAGVIVVPQDLSSAAAAGDLLLIWHATTAEEWRNRICFLPI